MKRAALSLMVLFGLSFFAHAGQDGNNESKEANSVKATKKTELKGPAFKNNTRKAEAHEEHLFSENEKQSLKKGPEFKNQKEYKSTDSYIKVETPSTKGPEFKNQRFQK